MKSTTHNPQLELAFDYVRNTNRNIFLTGKAGTGKTTFLHQIRNDAAKRLVVVAPTGVAAINAGGMTIHSFFQLPFGPYLPGNARDQNRQRRFSGEKIRLIQSLDLLVIDEISMVRADLLDGIDDVLRRYRDHSRPFGGVQLLMIGDLHQLPPVARDEEWNLLREHYASPYFFSSRALEQTEPVTIELKHIYRQSDTTFIDLLNKVRDNRLDAEVLATLNSRFVPNFQPATEEGYITLTAHNATAQEINTEKLAALPKIAQTFEAVISGEFPAQAYPADEVFVCKPGAQVMFVKNDLSRDKRYYNGKIGRITRIGEGVIFVLCPEETQEIGVEPVEWQNVKYALNEGSKEVNEEVIGTFTQYPLKLAWAITIHKSQGLTFERAIIDAQAAFAHGQVYVALSRCKSFEGIVLRSKIMPASVKTDRTVQHYSEEADRNAPDEAHLARSKREFQQALLLELFSFKTARRLFAQMNRVFLEHENTLQPEGMQKFKPLLDQAEAEVFPPAEKFAGPLFSYFAQPELPEENAVLQGRLAKACAWFADKLGAGLLPLLKAVPVITDNKAVRKIAVEALQNLQKEIFAKHACFKAAETGFSAQGYLRTKANAELDFQATLVAPPTRVVVPESTTHPVLYTRLVQWRDDQAGRHGVEPYTILSTRTLRELAQALPAHAAALRAVPGIGPAKSRQFGAEIVAIVREYCEAHDIATDTLSLPAVRPDTKSHSLDLYKAGKTIDEIAQERSLARSTIEGHLAHFVGRGELDIHDLMDAAAVEEIAAYYVDHQTTAASEVRAHFGEKYSYGELRLVKEYLGRVEQ